MKDWLFSNYSAFGERIVKPWGFAHILTLLICIALIFVIAKFRYKTEHERRTIIIFLASILLLFGIARRIINFAKMTSFTFDSFFYILLPRPWCAISCTFFIVSSILNKKTLYNITTMYGIICTLIFFAYPSVGFNEKFWVFEDLYSVGTHAVLLIGSVSLITLRFTDFKYKEIWHEALIYLGSLVYVAILILTGVEGDPMYFMPENEVIEIIHLNYGLYLVIYILFMLFYFNLFYFLSQKKEIFTRLHFHIGDKRDYYHYEKIKAAKKHKKHKKIAHKHNKKIHNYELRKGKFKHNDED